MVSSQHHDSAHPLAGQTVTVTPSSPLFTYEGTEPLQITVEDWNDRIFEGQSWMYMQGHPASLGYAMRSVMGQLPIDNEVVYGKCERGIGHLVHVSEFAGGTR